jgi:hypothetical protein
LEKFDCNLGGHFFQRPPDFLSGICQPVGVNVNSNAAAPAAHLSAPLKTRDRLFELMPALRALEFDEVRVTHGVAQYSIDLGISAKSMIGGHLLPLDAAASPANSAPAGMENGRHNTVMRGRGRRAKSMNMHGRM